MAQEDAGGAKAEGSRGLDEFAVAQREYLPAHESRCSHPPGEPQDERDHDHRWIDERHDGEQKNEPRKAEQEVDAAHRDRVDPAARITGDRTDEGPERDRDRDGERADG